MNQRKKEIKNILLVITLILFILISNLPTSNNLNPLADKREDFTPLKKDKEGFPLSSGLNLTDFITGDGINQTVRVYMNNKSISTNNPNGFFEIQAPADNMNLSSGKFDFNFDNNYTTEYIIEDDNALNPSISYFEEYEFDENFSNLTINEGIGDPNGDFNDVIDEDQDSYWNISTNGANSVDFTILANFSGAIQSGGRTDLPFKRNNIIGLILNFTYNISKDANISVQIRDFYNDEWRTVVNNLNLSQGNHDLDRLIVNENLKFINDSDCVLIRFIFNRTALDNFYVLLREFDFSSIVVLELPIADDNWVALEFDLRGANSTVNGFYVWIRALNLSEAQNTLLNITLYRADATMDRSDYLLTDPIIPELSGGKIYSMQLENYIGDELTYFEFDSSQTNNLTRFNYFIVIRSNRSNDDIYSLVTLPRLEYGDGNDNIEHQIKNSTDSGNTWSLSRSYLNARAFNALYLDASQFKLNVTRGYMPSDFKVDGVETLRIQDKYLDDIDDIKPPGEPQLTWGLGRWHNDFTNPIGNTGNIFQVELKWNNTFIKYFEFDVNYTVIAFRTENATSSYYANYDQEPQWIFNYSLNLDIFDIYKWNFTEFWYIYEDYFHAQNLTTKDGTQILDKTEGETDFIEMQHYKKVVVSTNIINISEKYKYNGTYSLNLTSYNAILDDNVHSFINYNEILWETIGFMYGDNISIRVDIQDHNGLAPSNANAFVNVSLFYPNGTLLSYLNSSNGEISKDKTFLSYDFNNQTILDLTENIPLEKDLSTTNHYSLGFFWINGSEIGCKKIPIYIDTYNINISDIIYDRNKGKNIVLGTTLNNVLDDYEYTMYIASVNETTGMYLPNFYPVSNLSVNKEYSYEPWGSGVSVPILMKSFMQNETVLNPEEEVNFKVSIQNMFIDSINVKISVKFVSLVNEQWIIAENESDTKNLKLFGDAGGEDVKEFNINLTIPKLENDLTWKGKNAPIRQGGAKTIVSVYIEENLVGTYESNEYSLLVNSTDDVFEGYIIALKNPLPGAAVGQEFERNECIYLPNKTLFIINIFDKNYVSIYNQSIKKFELYLDSVFTNIEYPDEITKGETFNISSILTTELGVILPFKNVTLQYDNDGTWVNISSSISDVNGSISFEINTLAIDVEEIMTFKLIWHGDVDYLNNSKIFTVPIQIQTNKISMSSDDDDSFNYNNRKFTIEVVLKNTGNSILTIDIDDIDIDIDEDFDYKIRGVDEATLKRFEPEESIILIIEIEVPNERYDEIEIKVRIRARNIISNEIITSGKTIRLTIIDSTLYDYIIEYFIVIIVLIFALICICAYYYAKNIKKKIELSAKEITEKRPRRGRYVKVSELRAEKAKKVVEIPKEPKELEPSEKLIEEKEKPIKVEEKKIIDLDTLLEEEEIKKGKIPSKEVEKPKSIEKVSKKKAELKKIKKEKVKLKKVKKKEAKIQKAKKKIESKKVEKKKIEPKKVEKKKVEPKKIEKKKTTDLDTLLEEEGLKEEKEPKKIPKKASEPSKKPKKLSTRQIVERKKGKKKSRKKKRT